MDNYRIYPKQFRNVKIPIEKNRCFFIMPFSKEYDIIYGSIKNDLSDTYVCSRVDEINGSTPIINKILVEILKSQYIIADLSFGNPNVLYELGVAHTFKDARNIFLLKDKNSKVPFDIIHLTYLEYDRSNLKYAISKLRESISETKHVSEFYEALNMRGIIPFAHDNYEYAIELIRELSDDNIQVVTDLFNCCCELDASQIYDILCSVGSKIKKYIAMNEYATVTKLSEFYFELLLSANQFCNIEPLLNDVFSNFFLKSGLSEKDILSLQTDCAVKFAKNTQRLNIIMPWIINYFKTSRFANVDLNRYKLESFLITNENDNINQIICNSICDPDAHVREHIANIIGEKRLTIASSVLTAQLINEDNYYTAASIIEALGKISSVSSIGTIHQWVKEHENSIIGTKSYFVLRHSLIALSSLSAVDAERFKQKYSKYLKD